MSKAKAKPRRRKVDMHVVIGSIQINGRQRRDINYSRIEYDDGTVIEEGLPLGMQPRPTIPDLIHKAFSTR